MTKSQQAQPAAAGATQQGATAPASPPSKAGKALTLLLKNYRLATCQDGKAYVINLYGAAQEAYAIEGAAFGKKIRQLYHSNTAGELLTDEDIKELRAQATAQAEHSGTVETVWSRVAEIQGGIEIDIGDGNHTRVQITAPGVQLLTTGSPTLFHRPDHQRAFALPAQTGDINKLLPYLNLDKTDQWLLIAWITYTLAHPKVASSKYVILVLRGPRGTGKSLLCNVVLQPLCDPGIIGIQAFPSSRTDFAIDAQHNHVVFYDNLRSLDQATSDLLCQASTSGVLVTRLLYTNSVAHVHNLHCAIVLNGIHPFIQEPDLAQRCLDLRLQPLAPQNRVTESQLKAQFAKDLPIIFRGLLDLIADIFKHLPHVQPLHPERMLEFVHWLTAMELALRLPVASLQRAYSDSLVRIMEEHLADHPLATAVTELARQKRHWSGTPSQLLSELSLLADPLVLTTRDWPASPIALSLRLKAITDQLSGAGVRVDIGRSKNRRINVTYTGKSS